MLHVYDYILFIFLIVAFFMDVRHYKLPNWLTAGGMLVGIMFHLITNGIDGLIFSFLGLLVAGGIFMILYIFKAIGAGDVKLFAAIGSLVGIHMVLYMMMYSIICGGIIGIIILLFTKTFLAKITIAMYDFIDSITSKDLSKLEDFKVNKGTKFPFMYAVIPGVALTYYYTLF